jgi:nucleoside-triphosphatase
LGINKEKEHVKKASISITGRPGVGKSTLALSIANKLKEYGCKVGGFITPEIREGKFRVGFLVEDFYSGKQVVLASRNYFGKIKIGSYYLNEEAFDFILNVLDNSIRNSDVIIIDEIGLMELKVKGFEEHMKPILEDDKPFIATFYFKLKWIRPDLYNLLNKGEIIELTVDNRYEYINKIDQYAKMIRNGAICA